MNVQLARLGYTGHWPATLARGVDVFFVISGFIMWVTTAGRPITPVAFYWRRIVRIVPLYWLLTSFTVAMMFTSPALLQSGRFDLTHVVASYLFLPAVHPVLGIMVPVVVPGWTLNYEIFFYAAFGASLLLPPARARLMAILTFLVAVVLFATVLPSDRVVRFYGSSIILEFGLGIALGAAFVRGRLLPVRVAWPSLLLGFAALLTTPSAGAWQVMTQGVPALAIVAGAVSLERAHRIWRIRTLRLIGDSSYSLYLPHGIVLSACGQAAQRLGIGRLTAGPAAIAVTAFALLGCVAATGAAILIYRWIERPLLRLCTTWRRSTIATVMPT